MSDLHKLFVKRVKQQEQAFGLALLSEEDDGTTPSLAELLRLGPAKPIASKKLTRSETNHYGIYSAFEDEKNSTFPIKEQYHDEAQHVTFQVYYSPPSANDIPIFICHHGAGSSSMTYCKLAQNLRSHYTNGTPGVLLFDMRGHGNSTVGDTNDFSLSTLTQDFKFVLDQFHKTHQIRASLYLVGHSLGGAVLTNYLETNKEFPYDIKGLVMLDIVEETAVSSLNSMPAFIDRLPKSFLTYQSAIDWHVKATRLLNSIDSAKVSVPDLFKDDGNQLKWCVNLKDTQPFWTSWFNDLSANFVSSGLHKHVAKLLMLAGHETLDTNLIIGQMQGKYQLIVFNNSDAGHFLHEDIPQQISISLLDFAKRNDSPDEYMKKELGFIPKWGGKINK